MNRAEAFYEIENAEVLQNELAFTRRFSVNSR
jgi:hypothetical protein